MAKSAKKNSQTLHAVTRATKTTVNWIFSKMSSKNFARISKDFFMFVCFCWTKLCWDFEFFIVRSQIQPKSLQKRHFLAFFCEMKSKLPTLWIVYIFVLIRFQNKSTKPFSKMKTEKSRKFSFREITNIFGNESTDIC